MAKNAPIGDGHRIGAEEIVALARADVEADGPAAGEPDTTAYVVHIPNGSVSIVPVDVRVSAASVPSPATGAKRPAPRPETPKEARPAATERCSGSLHQSAADDDGAE